MLKYYFMKNDLSKFDGSNHLKKDGRRVTKYGKVIIMDQKQLVGENIVCFCIYHKSNNASFSTSDILFMLFWK